MLHRPPRRTAQLHRLPLHGARRLARLCRPWAHRRERRPTGKRALGVSEEAARPTQRPAATIGPAHSAPACAPLRRRAVSTDEPMASAMTRRLAPGARSRLAAATRSARGSSWSGIRAGSPAARGPLLNEPNRSATTAALGQRGCSVSQRAGPGPSSPAPRRVQGAQSNERGGRPLRPTGVHRFDDPAVRPRAAGRGTQMRSGCGPVGRGQSVVMAVVPHLRRGLADPWVTRPAPKRGRGCAR